MDEAKVGDVILFFDPKSTEPLSDAGTNQAAVVIDSQRAVYFRRGVRILLMSDIWNLQNLERRRSASGYDPQLVANYFLRHIEKPAYVSAGLSAYSQLNMSPFIMGDLFPARPTYETSTEYAAAWEQMVASLSPMDCLFTAMPGDPLSRFIAWYTHGPFSHVAIYDGDGFISETVTAGTRYVPITTFRNRGMWVAAYRNVHNKGGVTAEQAKAILNKPFRPGYNYLGAAWAGTKAFFGNHTGAMTPNSMIYQGIYSFLGQA